MIPSPPQLLTPTEREAWIQARTRAEEYARGLGNRVDDVFETREAEVWGEDTPTKVPEREQHLVVREYIRELSADAVAQGRSVRDLASALGHATGDWARDWERIARTELQGSYNDGVVIDAVRWNGPNARIARVPEPNACKHCRAACLDDSGRPCIFTAAELLANGTNVGKRAEDWKPTLWPLHPNCTCDTQHVPAGMVYDAQWQLVPEQEVAA